jgi:hypothetical protein
MKDFQLAAFLGLLQYSDAATSGAGDKDINLMVSKHKQFLLCKLISFFFSLSVKVVGDWGGVPFPPYTTPGQRAVANSMGRLASELSATAVLALGDNFYFGM